MTYEWKVDLALVVSFASVVVSIVAAVAQRVQHNRAERLRTYDVVLRDVCHILEFPYRRRARSMEAIAYDNPDDAELQAAVRAYIDGHWMEKVWGADRLVPRRIAKRVDRLRYVQRIMEAASEFDAWRWQRRMPESALELSPVAHYEREEIAARMERILSELGARLSSCSKTVRGHWHDAKSAHPADVRTEYERALRACPNYFEHNKRDFRDPFYDLLVAVRAEHRQLTKTLAERLRGRAWPITRRWYRLRAWTSRIRRSS